MSAISTGDFSPISSRVRIKRSSSGRNDDAVSTRKKLCIGDANNGASVSGSPSASIPSMTTRSSASKEKSRDQTDNVSQLSCIVKEIVNKCSVTKVLKEPIFVGQLRHMALWDTYAECEEVPLHPVYMYLCDDLSLYIVELPYEKHDYFARNIFAQLRDQSQYVESVGSGRTNHMEADKRIVPHPDTPGLQLPARIDWNKIFTLVVEIGLSQEWAGETGLDEKARKWFKVRRAHGLQFILCVKIDVDDRNAISNVLYKLYDISTMDRFRTFEPTEIGLLPNAADATIELDARRVLCIPLGSPLPPEFNGDTFSIDLARTRDLTIRFGY